MARPKRQRVLPALPHCYIRSLETDLNGDQLVDNEDVRLMLQLTSTDLGSRELTIPTVLGWSMLW